MKTICKVNNCIVMSQDGEHVETMTANAQSIDGAVVEAVSVEQFNVLMQAQLEAEIGPKQKIEALERQNMLPRGLREFMLQQSLITAQDKFGLTEEQFYTANKAYKTVKDLDAQIAALRAQI